MTIVEAGTGHAEPFVGRAVHLAELEGLVLRAAAGHGRLVVLSGEPGIGKTRLAEEAAARAAARGAEVSWASCWEGEGAPAFWPWVQIMRSLVRRLGAEAVRAAAGAGSADLARLIPEIGDAVPAPELAPEEARFRLFDAVSTVLRAAGEAGPLVVVLDDLHWADVPSLKLLRFLSRHLHGARVLALGTYNDVEVDPRHRLAEILQELGGETIRLPLGGLTRTEVRTLVAGVARGETGPEVADAIWRQTSGNPFFVREVVRLMAVRGWHEPGSAPEAVPEGVREIVGRPLARLSRDCADLLAAAAVLGQQFDTDLLAALAGSGTGPHARARRRSRRRTPRD